MMLVYDIWMSNIIALRGYKEWPEIKTLINVRFCVYVRTSERSQLTVDLIDIIYQTKLELGYMLSFATIGTFND